MGQSRTHETHCRGTRPGERQGHWHMGHQGLAGTEGTYWAVLGTGMGSAPKKGGGGESAGGSEGSLAPGWAEMKGEAVQPLAGGAEGGEEVPGAPPSTQPDFRVPQVPGPDGCGWARRAEAPPAAHASPGHALLIPVPGAGSAQQRGRGQGKGPEGDCLPAQGPTPPEQAPGGRWGRCSWQRTLSCVRGKASKSLQGRAGPCTPWDWAQGEPFTSQGTQAPPPCGETGEPREGEQPFRSLSHIRCWKGGR